MQYRGVLFDGGIEQEGLNQTSRKQPSGDPNVKEVLHQGAWCPQCTTAPPQLGKRPVGVKHWNWNVLALKRAKEGEAPPDSPDIDWVYPVFYRPSPQETKMTPIGDWKWSHRPRTALLPRNSP